MSLAVRCAHCGRQYNVNERWAGQGGRCPGCGGVVEVRGRAPAAPGGQDGLLGLLDEVLVEPGVGHDRPMTRRGRVRRGLSGGVALAIAGDIMAGILLLVTIVYVVYLASQLRAAPAPVDVEAQPGAGAWGASPPEPAGVLPAASPVRHLPKYPSLPASSPSAASALVHRRIPFHDSATAPWCRAAVPPHTKSAHPRERSPSGRSLSPAAAASGASLSTAPSAKARSTSRSKSQDRSCPALHSSREAPPGSTAPGLTSSVGQKARAALPRWSSPAMPPSPVAGDADWLTPLAPAER